ncbi:NADH:ubiquinone dehydrogenase subunit 4, partial [Datura stramonium]|nr:NADH:ubiquinone dehydrogenase subunit 4 [Datura stramonium]
GPCAVNPLRAVVRRPKVVPAKLFREERGLCLFARRIPRQVSLGVMDTLARIRVTATREKSKGNCTRPGMDVNSGYLLELDQAPPVNSALEATPDSTIIIGVWGSRQRKIKAAYQLFLYTLLGSVFMLLAILLILLQTGTTDLQISLTTEFSERRQIFLWIASFASFAVKVPMVPIHIWLPEAHVEAPPAGSVILAGIALKLGTYGRAAAGWVTYFELWTHKAKTMCAGRATISLLAMGESIACRNKSLIRGVSKHCRLFQKQKPLSAPGREWGTALRAGNSSTGSTKSESDLSVGF